jgi:hypothetical protein
MTGMMRIAALTGLEPAIRARLARGDAVDSRGRTALMLAAHNGYVWACRLLLEVGADPTTSDHENETALALATSADRQKELRPEDMLLMVFKIGQIVLFQINPHILGNTKCARSEQIRGQLDKAVFGKRDEPEIKSLVKIGYQEKTVVRVHSFDRVTF